MPRPAHPATGERQIIRDLLAGAEILRVAAAVVHATVSTVPLVAPLLNLIVNESPAFNVSADP